MILKAGDKRIDLEKAFPMTIGDMRALKKLGVIDRSGDMDTGDPDKLAAMILHLARKVDAEVNEADVDKIEIADVKKMGDFIEAKMKEAGLEVDRPTSPPSTSSPRSGAGPGESSTS